MDLWIVMIQVLFVMVQVKSYANKKLLESIGIYLDDSGRYAYKQQPSICKWNCGKLAEALAPLLPIQKSKAILEKFDEEYDRVYNSTMRRKVKIYYNLLNKYRFFLI